MVGAEQLPGGWDVFAVFEIPEEDDKFRTNTEAVKSSDPRWQVRFATIQWNLSKHRFPCTSANLNATKACVPTLRVQFASDGKFYHHRSGCCWFV